MHPKKLCIRLSIVMALLLLHPQPINSKTVLLTQDQLLEILVDLELTKVMVYDQTEQEYQTEQEMATSKQAIFHQQVMGIYEYHGIDAATFVRSYAHHLANVDQVSILYDQLIKKLEEMV